MDIRDVLIKPIISEEAMRLASLGKYSFIVADKADKQIIKKTIMKLFNVHVVSVATTTLKGKTKRVGMRRTEKVVASVKKAIVTLKKGEKIDLFEPGGGEEEKKKK